MTRANILQDCCHFEATQKAAKGQAEGRFVVTEGLECLPVLVSFELDDERAGQRMVET